jgi:hypothetical protein
MVSPEALKLNQMLRNAPNQRALPTKMLLRLAGCGPRRSRGTESRRSCTSTGVAT